MPPSRQGIWVSETTLHRWRTQSGGMKAEDAKRLKLLEQENRRLKEIVADKELNIKLLEEVAKGKSARERSAAFCVTPV